MKSLASVLTVLMFSVDFCSATMDGVLHQYDTLHHRDIRHHHISKRSTSAGKVLNDRVISFDTLGRHFELHLTTNRKLFAPDFMAIAVPGGHNAKQESQQIQLDEDQFYEGYLGDDHSSRVEAYYEHNDMVVNIKTKENTYVVEPSWRHLPRSDDYTMIAYKASDVKEDRERHPTKHSNAGFCGYVREQGDAVNGTGLPTVEDDPSTGYTYTAPRRQQNRYRRQTTNLQTCPVILVADYHFFRNVGDNNTVTTSKYLAGVLSYVNSVYQSTDFGNGYTGMGFEIKGIQVFTGPTTDPEFNKEQSKWNTEALLKSFGKEDWTSVCTAHLFTYLPFDGGVQGLAWIASSQSNQVGGICSQVYNGIHYNTAWTSSQNSYGNRILSLEVNLIASHEFGHNWGSPHDPAECAPSVQNGGKYVMYQYSVSGYDPNNNIFSSCSRSSIGSVLQSKSSRCFTVKSSGICGNSQVEDGEECDAGTAGASGTDPCCSSTCTLKTGAICSDVNSVCCSGCQFAPTTVTCREGLANTCDAEANCTGTSIVCPPSSPKSNGTDCLDRGKCRSGACTPMCEFYGKKTCTCDQTDTACYYCCRDTDTSACLRFTEPGAGGPYKLSDGRSCFAGTCNQGTCEKSNADNTARLWDIIRRLDGNAILEWMRNNIVITVIVLSLVIYIPICIIVWCLDRRQAKTEKEQEDWMDGRNDRLRADGDNREFRRAAPRRRGDGYTRLQSGSGVSASGVRMSAH